MKIKSTPQLDMFGESPRDVSKYLKKTPSQFLAPSPKDLMMGSMYLEDYLKQRKIKAPLLIGQLLEEMDWSAFEQNYDLNGTSPYAPRLMLGIILYGLLNSVTSLRALERFAATDLGCMWLSGGILPDHATLGRFIHRHEELLTQRFFDDLVRQTLKYTHSALTSVAADGTVIESMASRFNAVKREALEEERSKLLQRQVEHPADQEVRDRLGKLEQIERGLQASEARKESPTTRSQAHVARSDPDAAYLPAKGRKGYGYAYVPSVLANEARVIISAEVDSSSETKVLEQLLNRANGISPNEQVNELLVDAGYHCSQVITQALKHDISLLCPDTPEHAKFSQRQSTQKFFPREDFTYHADLNQYQCPGGHALHPQRHGKDKRSGEPYTQYGTKQCLECPLKTQCSSGKYRTIQRSANQHLKDLLREQVMAHPQAKRRFKQRKAMVEPVFSQLRHQQGLRRFKRKGLAGVKLEFSLHAMAYNLGRVIAAQAAILCAAISYLAFIAPKILQQDGRHCCLHTAYTKASLNGYNFAGRG